MRPSASLMIRMRHGLSVFRTVTLTVAPPGEVAPRKCGVSHDDFEESCEIAVDATSATSSTPLARPRRDTRRSSRVDGIRRSTTETLTLTRGSVKVEVARFLGGRASAVYSG